MSRMKQLQEFNESFQKVYEEWQAIYRDFNGESHDQLALLDDYAIPDELKNPQPVSLEALQKHCIDKSRHGFSEQIRQLILSYGVDKLSEVNPENFPNLWKQVEELE